MQVQITTVRKKDLFFFQILLSPEIRPLAFIQEMQWCDKHPLLFIRTDAESDLFYFWPAFRIPATNQEISQK